LTETGKRIETTVLTIAGSDSCGGAGIQADLRTFAAFGVHGASVITAVTAQNTVEVRETQAISGKVIAAQLNAVLDDLPIGAIKTGMLPDAVAIEVVADILGSRCKEIPLIVDPVLVASSGAALTVEDTVTALQHRLFPLATLVTPNLSEARTLSGSGPGTPPAEVAGCLLTHGCNAVLLKGGHGESQIVVDRLTTADGETTFEHPYVPGDYHGTGCVLSSAIAAQMARGVGLKDAVRSGIEHVQSAIATARLPRTGKLHLLV